MIIGVSIGFFAINDAAKLTEYELSGDNVASVTAVIGEERKVPA